MHSDDLEMGPLVGAFSLVRVTLNLSPELIVGVDILFKMKLCLQKLLMWKTSEMNQTVNTNIGIKPPYILIRN